MATTARFHSNVFRSSLKKGILGPLPECSSLILFFDLGSFKANLKAANSVFPPNFKHTLAAKANPTLSVLKIAGDHGVGVESASMGELLLGIKAVEGCTPAANVPTPVLLFDSPVKTRYEIEHAIKNGASVNCDNFEEFEVMADVVAQLGQTSLRPGQRLGIRVNPQTGGGTNEGWSTAVPWSKFGIGIDQREQLLSTYQQYPWLQMIHVHCGSQTLTLDNMTEGINTVVDFAQAVNKQVGSHQIDTIDIGGGLAVNFASDEVTPTFEDYAVALRKKVGILFEPNCPFTVLTEFGRALVAKSGWFASRVEATKKSGPRWIALQHLGAGQAVRTIYHPKDWPLRIDVMDAETGAKRPETTAMEKWDVSGPCCIQGDIIAHERELPTIHKGDYIIAHDVGGYYHSSMSKYNCSPMPPLWGYETDGEDSEVVFTLLQKGETPEEAIQVFTQT